MGWLHLDWAWQLHGIVDRISAGLGMPRGLRDPEALRVDDAQDFWRVEMVEPGRLVRLLAEMRIPDRAWLEFEERSVPYGQTRLL